MESFIKFLLNMLPVFFAILVIVATQTYYGWKTKEKNNILSTMLLILSIVFMFSYLFTFELYGEFPYVHFILFAVCITSGVIMTTKRKDDKATISEHIVQ